MKIKWGALVVDGSGKLGGHVASKNNGGSYLRTKATPSNPQTVHQTNVRSIFADISSAWSGLTESQRSSFNEKVTEYAKTNIFGDLKNPSGKALFQRLNQNLALTGQAQLTACPNSSEIPTASISGIGAVVGADILVNLTSQAVGSIVVISATPQVSKGTSFVKNKYRQVQYEAIGVSLEVDITTSYVNRFGDLVSGQPFFISVKFINANGQSSPVQTIKVIP